jgi:hypothetical protein
MEDDRDAKNKKIQSPFSATNKNYLNAPDFNNGSRSPR